MTLATFLQSGAAPRVADLIANAAAAIVSGALALLLAAAFVFAGSVVW